MIDNPDMPRQLMKYIRVGLPYRGVILGRDGVKKPIPLARAQLPCGEVRMKPGNGKQLLIITELPYQVNKARLIEKIAELVGDKKIEGITDLRDETDRQGMRVVIELRRDANPHIILNKLYKHTQLQQNFGINMLALVNDRPTVLTLRDMLYHYLVHQQEIITRRTRHDLKKAEERLHILAGFIIALDNPGFGYH